ncbi:hypothetical protein H5410_026528 [Solanum commersonii]|uniref:F-box domain-containing protein n=1 Tax=Solanum commersonii TaxID=4109 RepID=A0A9J5Z0Y4_SOLCO|nr:hypothetical protein H5410_026528 [Solanum commersonii]
MDLFSSSMLILLLACFMMFPKGEIHGCQCQLLDMLSILPVNVINSIFMDLPLRDVVRTSILSKN